MYHDKHSAGFVLHHPPRHAKPSGHSAMMRAACAFLAAACLVLSVTVYPASAATSMSSLQNKLDKISASIKQHKTELNDAKKKEAAAKALESELKEKVSVLQSQISVLKSQISEVQNSIGVKEQEITAKQNEIAQKEQEIADQWDDFKSHMAAMQELRDGGSVAMLRAVSDLYELLTFNEVMQDISVKDTEILDNMKAAKEALVADRTQLVEERTQLQNKKAELDAQNKQMQSKQSELNNSVKEARLSAAEAQQAQKNAQAAIESDEMNYEAVKKEIQKLIAAAAASKPQLSFSGFICPLRSYTRISSEYGWRKNPVSGVNKLHAGTDFAAPAGTPIYDSIIPTMLSTLPDVLIGLVIVLVLSASMSTLSSLVLTSSSTLTIDFINGNIIKNMSEKKQLIWMRGLLVGFIAISALIALFQYHSSVVFIAQLMGYSWGALAGSFLGPFLWGLYSGRISKASVWCSFAVGVGLTAVNMGLALSGGVPLIASPINCGALCMIISLVIVPVASLFTPAVPFQIKPPTTEGAIDREYDRELAQEELESATVSAADV